jgi:hypothetical protein
MQVSTEQFKGPLIVEKGTEESVKSNLMWEQLSLQFLVLKMKEVISQVFKKTRKWTLP